MRLTILAGIAAILALLASSPLHFGGQMQRAYDASVEQWLPERFFTIKERSFSKGWFSSVASVRFSLRDELCGDPCPILLMYTRIDHGPIPFGASETLGDQLQVLRGTMVTMVDIGPLFRSGRIEPGLPPLAGYTRVQLTGAKSTRFEMPAFTQTLSADSESFSLMSDGLLGVLNSRDAQRDGSLELPQLEATGQAGRNALLSGIRANADGRTSDFGFLGTWAAQLERARLTVPGEAEPFGIDNLSLSSNKTLDDASGTVSGNWTLAADRIALPEEAVGSSRIDVDYANWDAAALRLIGKQLWRASNGGNLDALGVAQILAQNAALLAPHGLSLTINELRTTTARGVASINGFASVEPLDRLTEFDPERVFEAITVSMRLEVDEPVVRRWLADPAVGGRLESLITDNLLQRRPDGLIAAKIEYKAQQLYINGAKRDDWPEIRGRLSRQQAEPAEDIDDAPIAGFKREGES